ncbi:MAG: UDP-2,4-diacetamido-2,4,6-trideoxy-beta-L-altropyranose hydrolase [Proteobacteria bacterium]|nr:UDP-2,4-diacetamido-2,4,6-trideoxy-beta-L-altropyranose hydrolase [Pseudomonadota bacterium]MBU1388897.1 UDP-2,4-diacetamido-2,4,6-trideoxy-beta-L-altropyranose hydrolase [Pseudomonadota bacterium]MBU1543449.1 UDP-2,4-diacetamido-2,4,6-trideoxy-beta-L-altropyranose hydrolase [Pseudomonadota bacterium]MBU2430962.1 UDP-2,4-diacetamido-2,4,6-trideoxy-beta-L-altropyranose hydrolase [Pseudomonadota bacterium]MBU2480780.1 UDP-2,4-diacetamido-2,4,6-trideoxy-beta-L-altropyranose hydrolase [Pseudomon
MNRLFIRADATISMGTGHIMRCIALGQAWKKQGGAVSFISHSPSKAITNRLDAEGFDLIRIKGICPDTQDIETTLDILCNPALYEKPPSSYGDQWVVLDGYHFTPEYQKAITGKGLNLLVIDDYNHLDQYHATLLLNQNLGSDRYHYVCPDDTTKLSGTQYIMLRSEFLTAKPIQKNACVNNILVTMGGSDPNNLTLKVIEAINEITHPDLKFKIIVGPDNPNTGYLKTTFSSQNSNTELIENADMPQMMAWADLAVTAGGSTCWELCYMAVPFIITTVAQNQIELSCALEQAGAAVCMGKDTCVTPQKIKDRLLALICDPEKLERMKQSGTRLVDGKGSSRIIRAMVGAKIVLRSARINDAKLLYDWANEKETRAASFNPDPISWEAHLAWFEQKISDQNTWIYIARNHMNNDIGMIRFDKTEDFFKISYLIDKNFRGQGLGSGILKAGIEKIKSDIKLPAQFAGEIKTDNPASIKSFENCGFSLLKKKEASVRIPDHCVYQFILNPVEPEDQP